MMGFQKTRAHVRSAESVGWKRARMIISGGIFVLMIVLALENPNVVDVPVWNSSLDCVPGTYSESARRPEHGFFPPAQERTEVHGGQIAGLSPGMAASDPGMGERPEAGNDQIATFTCTSYLGLILALVAAASLSIGVAVMFRFGRWIYGIRKN